MHQTPWGRNCFLLSTALRIPKWNWTLAQWSKCPKLTQFMRSRSQASSEPLFLYLCASSQDRFCPQFDGTNVLFPQSTSDFSFSVIIENVNCYSSGIICRKFISINVGNSLIIFEDDSGNPVRPGAGQGWRDNQSAGKWAGSKESWEPNHSNYFLNTVELSQWLNLLVVRVRNNIKSILESQAHRR